MLMGAVEDLVRAYERFVRLPWESTLAGPQRVWFAIYEPTQERRLRLRIPEFEVATKVAGHRWRCVDLTDSFAQWMAQHEYREAYFAQPETMQIALVAFGTFLAQRVTEALTAPDVDEQTMVAIVGVGSLFGLSRVSSLIEKVAPAIRGRLLVFFPGQRDRTNYRLLDARDGWDYLAVPITATEDR